MDKPERTLFFFRYTDLVERKIITNRTTLRRWSDERKEDPFPAPIRLGENSIAWRASDVEEWLRRRAHGGNAA
jgi:predicted DNA-binding transcriptional regulator AlpA